MTGRKALALSSMMGFTLLLFIELPVLAEEVNPPCLHPCSTTPSLLPDLMAPALNALSNLDSNGNPIPKTYLTEEEAWKDSGLRIDKLSSIMDNASCAPNPEACFWSINKILDYLSESEELIWVPKDYYVGNKALFSTIKDEKSSFVLTAWRPLSEKDPVRREKLRMEQKRALNRFLRSYRSDGLGFATPLDFETLLNSTVSAAMAKDCAHEAEITVDAWNEFLKIRFDPHDRVVLADDVLEPTRSFAGIGVSFHLLPDRKTFALVPMEGTPAHSAGIQENDILLEVNGKPVQGLSPDEVDSMMTGDEGTSMRLTVSRNGERKEFEITRQRITRPNTTKKQLTFENQQIGYVRLHHFTKESCAEVKNDIQNLLSSHPKGLILDLRNNRGGYIKEAVCIASLLMQPGTPIYQTSAKPIVKTSGTPITDLPLTILMDSKSASASELLAGALQENGRALIVGERSYGKGSYQGTSELSAYPMLERRHTKGLYYLPSGQSPQVIGIRPDIEVFGSPSIKSEQDAPATIREEDKYLEVRPNVPPSGPVTPPTPMSRDFVHRSRRCMTENKYATQKYMTDVNAKKVVDYQVIYSGELLAACWNK